MLQRSLRGRSERMALTLECDSLFPATRDLLLDSLRNFGAFPAVGSKVTPGRP
jgi:hypothetical protein